MLAALLVIGQLLFTLHQVEHLALHADVSEACYVCLTGDNLEQSLSGTLVSTPTQAADKCNLGWASARLDTSSIRHFHIRAPPITSPA